MSISTTEWFMSTQTLSSADSAVSDHAGTACSLRPCPHGHF